MSKTNFKCMFLIDDKLYNRAILREGGDENTNIKATIPNSTYLTPFPSSRQLITDKPTDNMNTPSRLNLSHELREINDSRKVDNGQQIKIDLSDKVQQTEIPFASTSSDNTDPLTKSENNDEMEIGQSKNEKEIGQSKNEKEDCDCSEKLPKASSSYKRPTGNVKKRSARPSRKLTTLKPLMVQAERS